MQRLTRELIPFEYTSRRNCKSVHEFSAYKSVQIQVLCITVSIDYIDDSRISIENIIYECNYWHALKRLKWICVVQEVKFY